MRAVRSAGARTRVAASSSLLVRLALGVALVGAVPAAGAAAAPSPWWGGQAHDAAAVQPVWDSSTPPRFQLPLGHEHPLQGRIFDVRHARFVSPSQMLSTLSRVRLVLFGEQHDNADHHRLQAWLIGAVARDGRRPRVVVEMIDAEKQADVDRSLQQAPGSADALAAAIAWDKSGWPAFAMYRPVFAAALSRRLPIVAAGLSRARLAAADFVAAESAAGEDPALRRPLPNRIRDAMAADIRASHCGYAHDSMIAAMIPVQRRRDATMARALLAAGRGEREGAVLVAGFGHARTDYGVPMVLHDLDASATVRSVGFLEVQTGADDPADYAAALSTETLPFDYVWFTPRANDEDPCEKFRQQLETMGTRHGPDHDVEAGAKSGAETSGAAGKGGAEKSQQP